MTTLHLDLETYSEIDITTTGLYRYAEDASTEILMLAWAIDDGPIYLLDPVPSLRDWPKPLLQELRDPHVTLCAFNAAFERILLRDVAQLDIPVNRWHCTMVHGFGLSFAGGLGAQAQATGITEQKQEEGKKLVQRFSKPQPAGRKIARWTRDNDPENWARFGAYCRQDVATERELQRFYDQYPLLDQVWTDWELDQRINDRGLPTDQILVAQANILAERTRSTLLVQLRELTQLDNPNSSTQLLAWLREQGLPISDLQAATVAHHLQTTHGPAHQVLELKQQLAKSSVSKLDAFTEAVCADGRIRGTLQYLGASRTGRWSGRLVQIQNLPRPQKGLDINAAITAILTDQDVDNPLHAISAILRGIIRAENKQQLVVSDLAGIEGRVLPWLCFDDTKLEAIAAGRDMYKVAAAEIYHVDYETVSDAQRQVGKVCELALGYQGGVNALNTMARAYGLPPYSEAEGRPIVQAWRRANPTITKFWNECQRASRLALANQDKVFLAGRLRFVTDKNFLLVTLPSGRVLYYFQPWQDEEGNITYMGMNQYTRQWERQSTYGGKFCENATQAVSRDILAYGMQLVERAGFKIVGSVHDEIITEQRTSKRHTAIALSRLMSTQPPWATDLPLAAKGYEAERYRKD